MKTDNPLLKKLEDFTDCLAGRLDAPDTLAKIKELMDFWARFHSYSFCNQMLILWQKPNASYVKGYNGWQDFGRYVKKGEKGIFIWGPNIKKDKTTGDSKLVGFSARYVFDVSQTEGKEFNPPTCIKEQGEHLAGYVAKLETFCQEKGFPVKRKELSAKMGGYADGTNTVVNAELNGNSTFKTMVHEITHNLAHFALHRRDETSQEQREAEAELSAYLVAKHFGVDSDISAVYLKNWKATGEVLRKAFQNVGKVAKEIIEYLEPATV